MQSTVAVPVPPQPDPYCAFYIRFSVQARSANETGTGFYWTSDTVVFDADPQTAAGPP